MGTSRRCQAVLAGVALTIGLLLLASQLWHLKNDSWITVFEGGLPPVPEYGPGDEVKELHYTDNRKPGSGLDTSTLGHAIEETSSAAPTPTPSMTRMLYWDTTWEDRGKWPGWSTPGPTPTTSSVPSPPVDEITEADLEDHFY